MKSYNRFFVFSVFGGFVSLFSSLGHCSDYKVTGSPENSGRLRGVCRMDLKEITDEQKTVMPSHAELSGKNSNPSIEISATGALGNCFIKIKGIGAGKEFPQDMQAEDRVKELRIIDGAFANHLTIIRTQTQLQFENTDSLFYSLYLYRNSFADTQNRFNVGEQQTVADHNQNYIERDGIYILGADNEARLNGYVIVVDHPYFAVTSSAGGPGQKAGEFQIDDIPAGSYIVEVWHEGILKRQDRVIGASTITTYERAPAFVQRIPVRILKNKTLFVDAFVSLPGSGEGQ